jgi:hypothetical protein
VRRGVSSVRVLKESKRLKQGRGGIINFFKFNIHKGLCYIKKNLHEFKIVKKLFKYYMVIFIDAAPVSLIYHMQMTGLFRRCQKIEMSKIKSHAWIEIKFRVLKCSNFIKFV